MENQCDCFTLRYTRSRNPSSGIQWQPGTTVPPDNPIVRKEEITINLPDSRPIPITLVRRDYTTDIAVFKVQAVTLLVR